MKKLLTISLTLGALSLQSCGTKEQLSNLNEVEVVDVIENEAKLLAEIDQGKACVEDLGFFKRLKWKGFKDVWDEEVSDGLEVVLEQDKPTVDLYAEVLLYNIGCGFANDSDLRPEIEGWAELIKETEDTPELIVPAIKEVYRLAKERIQF